MRYFIAVFVATTALCCGFSHAAGVLHTFVLAAGATFADSGAVTGRVDLAEYRPGAGVYGLHYVVSGADTGTCSTVELQVSADDSHWADNQSFSDSGTSTNLLTTIQAAGIGNGTNVATEIYPIPARYIRLIFTSSAGTTNTISAYLTVQ